MSMIGTSSCVDFSGYLKIDLYRSGVFVKTVLFEKNHVLENGIDVLRTIIASWEPFSNLRICRIEAGNGYDEITLPYINLPIITVNKMGAGGSVDNYKFVIDNSGGTFLPANFWNEVIGRRFTSHDHFVYGLQIVDAGEHALGQLYITVFSRTLIPAIEGNGSVDSKTTTAEEISNSIYRKNLDSVVFLPDKKTIRFSAILNTTDVSEEDYVQPNGSKLFVINEISLLIADRTLFVDPGIERSSDGGYLPGQTNFALKKFERIGFSPEENLTLNITWDLILRN